MQAYLGGIMGLVPDHSNKEANEIFGFLMHIKVTFTL